jgi:hypothetical protein
MKTVKNTEWLSQDTFYKSNEKEYYCYANNIKYELREDLYDPKKTREENIEKAKYEIIKSTLRGDVTETAYLSGGIISNINFPITQVTIPNISGGGFYNGP